MIKEKSENYNIILLGGIGKIFPIIRSHMILNNLQNTIDIEKKIVLFFPGEYTIFGLKPFGLFTDDNYYRAFRICE